MWLASWFLVQTFLGAKQQAQIYDANRTRTHTCVFHFSYLIELYNVKNLLIQMALETDIQPGSEARGGEGGQLPPLTLLPNPFSIGFLDYFAPQWQSHLRTEGALAPKNFEKNLK